MLRSLATIIVYGCLAAAAVAQSTEQNSADPTGGEFGRIPGGLADQGAAGGSASNAMFKAIDADGDGAITMRELRKAVVALKQLDADKDGKITLAEAMDGPTATMQSGHNQLGGAVGRGTLGSGTGGFGGAAGSDPRPSGPNLLQYDRNHDGQLSADELPTQMRGMLRGADQNRDGQLDAGEVQAIQQRVTERLRGQRPLPTGVSVGPNGVQGVPQKP